MYIRFMKFPFIRIDDITLLHVPTFHISCSSLRYASYCVLHKWWWQYHGKQIHRLHYCTLLDSEILDPLLYKTEFVFYDAALLQRLLQMDLHSPTSHLCVDLQSHEFFSSKDLEIDFRRCVSQFDAFTLSCHLIILSLSCRSYTLSPSRTHGMPQWTRTLHFLILLNTTIESLWIWRCLLHPPTLKSYFSLTWRFVTAHDVTLPISVLSLWYERHYTLDVSVYISEGSDYNLISPFIPRRTQWNDDIWIGGNAMSDIIKTSASSYTWRRDMHCKELLSHLDCETSGSWIVKCENRVVPDNLVVQDIEFSIFIATSEWRSVTSSATLSRIDCLDRGYHLQIIVRFKDTRGKMYVLHRSFRKILQALDRLTLLDKDSYVKRQAVSEFTFISNRSRIEIEFFHELAWHYCTTFANSCSNPADLQMTDVAISRLLCHCTSHPLWWAPTTDLKKNQRNEFSSFF